MGGGGFDKGSQNLHPLYPRGQRKSEAEREDTAGIYISNTGELGAESCKSETEHR